MKQRRTICRNLYQRETTYQILSENPILENCCWLECFWTPIRSHSCKKRKQNEWSKRRRFSFSISPLTNKYVSYILCLIVQPPFATMLLFEANLIRSGIDNTTPSLWEYTEEKMNQRLTINEKRHVAWTIQRRKRFGFINWNLQRSPTTQKRRRDRLECEEEVKENIDIVENDEEFRNGR